MATIGRGWGLSLLSRALQGQSFLFWEPAAVLLWGFGCVAQFGWGIGRGAVGRKLRPAMISYITKGLRGHKRIIFGLFKGVKKGVIQVDSGKLFPFHFQVD